MGFCAPSSPLNPPCCCCSATSASGEGTTTSLGSSSPPLQMRRSGVSSDSALNRWLDTKRGPAACVGGVEGRVGGEREDWRCLELVLGDYSHEKTVNRGLDTKRGPAACVGGRRSAWGIREIHGREL